MKTLAVMVGTAAVATGLALGGATPASADTIVSCQTGVMNYSGPPFYNHYFDGENCVPAPGSNGGAPHYLFAKRLWFINGWLDNRWVKCDSSHPTHDANWHGDHCQVLNYAPTLTR